MRDYIAVDWGSTQLRGWLIRNGQCVETKQLPLGITRLNGRAPADIFEEHLAPWRGAATLPVLMAGMIGSDAGWQAVPYLACPAAIDAPGQQLCAVAEDVWIIPGLKMDQAKRRSCWGPGSWRRRSVTCCRAPTVNGCRWRTARCAILSRR